MKPKPANAWTPEEDQILLRYGPTKGAKKLPHRSLSACRVRLHKIKNPHLYRYGGPRWSPAETARLRRLYPFAQHARDIVRQFPGRSVNQLITKASQLKVKRIYLGEDSLPDSLDLVDQIRIRAKEDGITFTKLDEICESGSYFLNSYKKLNGPRLKYVAKAVEFFGGKLVIDWQDR